MTAPLWGYLAIVKQTFRTLFKVLPYALIGSVLVGCAGANVAVQTTRLPVPVVETLPVSVAIHLSDEVRSFSHEEAIRDYGTFRISVGAAQDLMFNNLAEGLFANHRFVSNVERASDPSSIDQKWAALNPSNLSASSLGSSALAAPEINAILVPTIGELQFSIPAQTKSDFYEVWLRYSFKLLSPDGSQIAEWPMQAYGRANRRNYGILEDTEQGALQEASRVALRDAMAVFTFKFQRVPEIKAWLEQFKTPTSNSDSINRDSGPNGQSGGYE